jgi:predicted permease
VEQAKELQRDARSFIWLDDLKRDIGYGIRTLGRTPGFTLTAMLTLALGIGAVTIIYSVLRNVVLDPFPYSRSDRMVNAVLLDASGRRVRGAPYYPAPEFLDYQEQTQAFEDVVGTSMDGVHWVSESGAERLLIAWMTPNGFAFLGVPPLLGRVFGAADAAPGAPPVAVMNHRAWVRLFNADPAVIGRTLILDGQPWTVVGVMPPRFEWNIADLWLPSALVRTDDSRSARNYAFQAHLRPGVTTKEAEAQLNVVAARRAREHPNDYPPGSRFQVIKVIDWVVRDFRGVLYTLFGAVGLLLVIACCNVANMLLARATTREREIGVRAALGASRGRIARQLFVESTLLALGGLIAGCLLAYVGIAALAGFMPRQGVPWETQIRLDQPVLFFALAAAAIATVGFGLFPAVQGARRDLVAATNVGNRGSGGRRQKLMRSSLVVAQVALSIVLLLGAGLLMRGFVKLVGFDFGFDTKNVLLAGLAFPPQQTISPEEQREIYRQTLERVGSIPGIRAAALVTGPFGGQSSNLEVPGTALPPQASTLIVFASGRLVEALGLSLVKGRSYSAIDVEQSHHVALVNETLARRYLGSDDPLGRTIRLPRLATLPMPVEDPTFQIVGVVRDIANQGPQQPPTPQVYLPSAFHDRGFGLLLRTTDEPLRLLNTIRREVQAVNRELALVEPVTVEELIQRAFYARPRFSLLVLGIFSCTGLVLVAFGVYGVLAYTVSQQTREIAIRMALGGERGHVVRMVLRLGLRLVGIGLVIGVAASLATNRLLVNQLFNIAPTDPMTFAAVTVAVVLIGALACWIPARRAVRVEPMVALRHE